MKYIRTKDGRIYKIFKENISLIGKNDGYACYGENTVDFMTAIYIPKPVEKVADTIEELCDEFVLYDSKDMINTFISTYERVMNWKEVLDKRKLDKSNYEIYGAIWTDKGLIYVAKMNDKGELELL